jgi:hypothetical protein
MSAQTHAAHEAQQAHEALRAELAALRAPVQQPELDALLTRLLALPHDLTQWGEVLKAFQRHGHPDLPAVYRRIAADVGPTGSTHMAFFHWAAADLFADAAHRSLLPEVAAGFAALDGATYDADGLAHIEEHLLAAGFDAQTLALAERFLPVTRASVGSGALGPHVLAFSCDLVFQLRVGLALRTAPAAGTLPGALAGSLRRDIEDEIDLAAAEHAAAVICAPRARASWSREDFQLPAGNGGEAAGALALQDTLMEVAREGWHREQLSPGCGYHGLCRLLESVLDARDEEADADARGNLLDWLDARGLADRIAQSCADILGMNASQAQVMLDAHGLLLRCAEAHALLAPDKVAGTRAELARVDAMREA